MIDNTIKEKIKLKIDDVEKKSSCEFVAIAAQKSDEYTYIPIMYAALLALLFPIVYFSFLGYSDFYSIYTTQLLVFAVILVVVQNPYVKYALIPKSVKHKRASRHAHELFITSGLHNTSNNQAVLFFVSLKEKYVEIIVDSGISEKIDNAFLEKVVKQFTQKVKEGKLEEGYLEAIDTCASKIIEVFPSKEQRDVLPNDLIIV